MMRYLLLLALTIIVYADSSPTGKPVLPPAGDLDSTSSGISAGKPRLSRASLPLYFIENKGQLDDRVSHYVQGADKSLLFTKSGLTLDLHPPKGDRGKPGWVVKLDFAGSTTEHVPVAEDPSPATVSYFHGPRENWVTSLKTWKKLAYNDAWPGIDLTWSGNSEELTGTFTIRPGADPARIALAWSGITGSRTRQKGLAEIVTPFGTFQLAAPEAHQIIRGRKIPVPVSIDLDGGSQRFRLGIFQQDQTVTVTAPMFVFAGFIPGTIGGGIYVSPNGVPFLRPNGPYSAAVDTAGNSYFTGSVYLPSADFPLKGGPNPAPPGAPRLNVFVAKVTADGSEFVYCAYVGGSSEDYGNGIAVDSLENVYITGDTASSDFPVLNGPPGRPFNGSSENTSLFAAKIRSDGTALVYSGYLGPGPFATAAAVAVDAAGSAYITGSGIFEEISPVVGPQLTCASRSDICTFIIKLTPSGSAYVYAGFIDLGAGPGWNSAGGTDPGRCCFGTENAAAIAVDASGSAYVAGTGNYPETFVAKVSPDGSTIQNYGYLIGYGATVLTGFALDASDNMYVTGSTTTTEGFPVRVGPRLSIPGPLAEIGFISKIKSDFSGLIYSGFIDGTGGRIGVDNSGSAYIVSPASGIQVPLSVDANLTGASCTLSTTSVIESITADGTGFGYRVCFGDGNGGPQLNGAAFDSMGNAWFIGAVGGNEFASIGPYLSDSQDGSYVGKMQPPGLGVALTGPSGSSGSTQTFTAVFTDAFSYRSINFAYLLFGYPRDPANACYVFYDATLSQFDLVNDAGTGIQGSIPLGSTSQVQNSQCTLNGAGSLVSGTGNNLTVMYSLTFHPTYKGTKAIYGYAFDSALLNTGWQQIGTWTPNLPVTAPVTISGAPSSGSGAAGRFTLTVSDPTGSMDWVQLIFNEPYYPGNSCYVLYNKPSNLFYLADNPGTGVPFLGPVTPGSAGVAQNRQCTIDGSSSATSLNGQLSVTYSLKFDPSYAGSKTPEAIAYDSGGINSNWQPVGTWTVTAP